MTTPQRASGRIDFVEFPAPDEAALARTKDFLAATFGWSFRDYGDDYADVTNAGLGAGVNADPAHRPSHPLVVIHVDKLEAARERVVAEGGRITREIFAFPGGRRFHFADPAGNELAAWSER
jgi:predicted enzyme related to lactoylglutathione lyase